MLTCLLIILIYQNNLNDNAILFTIFKFFAIYQLLTLWFSLALVKENDYEIFINLSELEIETDFKTGYDFLKKYSLFLW